MQRPGHRQSRASRGDRGVLAPCSAAHRGQRTPPRRRGQTTLYWGMIRLTTSVAFRVSASLTRRPPGSTPPTPHAFARPVHCPNDPLTTDSCPSCSMQATSWPGRHAQTQRSRTPLPRWTDSPCGCLRASPHRATPRLHTRGPAPEDLVPWCLTTARRGLLPASVRVSPHSNEGFSGTPQAAAE